MKKTVVSILCGAFIIGGLTLGFVKSGALAYLTDADLVKNEFVEGKVNVKVTEPNWTEDPEDPGDKENVVPGDIFNKDPMITAEEDSVTPAFVYMQVKVPYGTFTKVNDDGSLYDKDENGNRTKANHMLLTFGEGELSKDIYDEFLIGDASVITFDDASVTLDAAPTPNGHAMKNNINATKDGWTLLQVEKTALQPTDDDADGNIRGYLVFTYSYNSMLANTDKVSSSYASLVNLTISKFTTPLFEQVRALNCVEGQLSLVKYQMPIKVFAIQAAHTGTTEITNDIPATTEDVIAQAKTAYAAYTEQNLDNGTATTIVSNFAS